MKTTRRLTQLAFLSITLVGIFVLEGDAERWCPLGGVEALYSYVTVGNMTCSLGVSNFYILGALLLLTLLARRAFCGYMCPIGTISEWLQSGARRLGLRPLRVPYRLDRGLALLKYPVLAIILYITWKAGELLFRAFDPCYALISRHGKDITVWAYIVSGAIVLASLVIVLPFCRWLCPLAAVFTPFSRVGLARVKRDGETCEDCGECNRVCPMGIQVNQVKQVTAARCTACLDCVAACPRVADGALTWGPPKALGNRWPQAALVVVLLACVGGAIAATYAFPFPSFVTSRGEPPAETETIVLRIDGVRCRGTSQGFVNWLQRADEYGVPGYFKVETWPASTQAQVRITFDPSVTNAAAIKRAITEPAFDADGVWSFPPYEIEGYDLLDAED